MHARIQSPRVWKRKRNPQPPLQSHLYEVLSALHKADLRVPVVTVVIVIVVVIVVVIVIVIIIVIVIVILSRAP